MILQKFKPLLLLVAGAFCLSPLHVIAAPEASEDHAWHVEIAPYLWALNMNGSVQIANQRAPVNQNFSDILSQLNWAGMLWADAHKDKFGIFANALYASLSNSANDQTISAHVNNTFKLYSAGVSYQVYATEHRTFTIEPYVGARYTANDVQLTVSSPVSVRGSDNQSWTDPILGARFNFNLSKAWLLNLAGDIGGTNTTTDYSYNAIGLVGYKPQTMWKITTWYIGYRLLGQHYVTGSGNNTFDWDMKLHGVLGGVSFALY